MKKEDDMPNLLGEYGKLKLAGKLALNNLVSVQFPMFGK
jgi:hypothetical protein